MNRALGLLAVAAAMLFGAASAPAASLQPIGNFAKPIYLTSDPGNAERLFVVEREGQIVSVEKGVVTEFADLRSVVGCCTGEQGLLSIALAPDFDSSGRLYVDYTDRSEPGAIHVAELRANGSSAPLSSLRNLLTIPHPNFAYHYGGQLQFGPEGLLYISTGDGGGSNDAGHNAQSLTSLLGKILRIDPDPSGVLPYTVPAGNPFPLATAPFNTIFSYGLRNPYRFSFDRLNHDLVIADVGETAREEVDWAPVAANLGVGADYGWNCREGRLAGAATDPECATPPAAGFVDPTFEYPHAHPATAIIGGYVVRDPSLGSLYGRYLYGDFGSGEVRSLALPEAFASDRSEGIVVENLNSFGEDSCGRLYAISGNGTVSRLVGATAAVCPTPPGPPLDPSTIGIRAVTRRVKHGGRAQITAWVSPCAGRRGEPVRLYRGRARLGTHRLDRACTVRFLPKVSHGVRFRAVIGADSAYLAATSRPLGIRTYHPKKQAGKRGAREHIPPGVGHR